MMHSPKRLQHITGYLMVVAAAIAFGANGTFSRLLFDRGVTPLNLTEMRLLLGGSFLLILLLMWRRHELKFSRHSLGWLAVYAVALIMVMLTYFVAISRVPVAVALVIQFTASAWMALAEAIWRRRWPPPAVIGAILLTLSGVVLLTGLWQNNLNGLDPLGLIFAVLALLAFVAYLLVGQRVGRDIPALPATTYAALLGGGCLIFFQPPWTFPAVTWQLSSLILIVLVGIVGMAIPFSLDLAALRRIDATRVGIVAMLELVAGSVIAYFWLDQRLSFWQVLGCLCVLVGVTVLQLEKPEPSID